MQNTPKTCNNTHTNPNYSSPQNDTGPSIINLLSNTKEHRDYKQPVKNRSWVFTIRNAPEIDPKYLPPNLLFAIDINSNILFLIDSGSEISILPKNLTNGVDHFFKNQSRSIKGIGHEMIHPIGSVNVNLNIGELGTLNHDFWVTQEKREYGIIGLDIIKSLRLIINPITQILTNALTGNKAKLYTANEIPSSVLMNTHQINIDKKGFEEECENLLDKFPELTDEPNYKNPVKHGHSLEIKVVNYEPKMIKARKCNGAKREVVENNFQDLINRGALTRIFCQTMKFGVSPITIVPKKDNTMRICIDYTELNKHTVPLSYPLPRIDDLPQIIPNGTKFFSCLDLKEAYYSLPIESNSQHLAAIIAHHGVFIPRRTTFGLKNAPMRFQQMMESILYPCSNYIYIYLDDILVYSDTRNHHLEHLQKVFQILKNNGLYLNKKKCVFAKSELSFLGHSVGVNGINVLDSKVEAINNLPLPTNRKELKRFLGLVNYYNKHLPKLAEITAPLNEISGGPKSSNRKRLILNDIQKKSYQNILSALSAAATINFEDHKKPLIIYSDASASHVGAVLEQEGDNGEKRPLAFFSKKLPTLKRIRSTFYKELRALYLSLKHFQSRIVGRELIVRTDNKSVEAAVNNPIGNQSPMEQRYIAAIKEYNPTVIYIAGSDNMVADILSRPPQVVTTNIGLKQPDSDYIYTSDSDTDITENDSSETEKEVITANSLNRIEIANLQNGEPDLINTAKKLNKKIYFSEPNNLATIREGDNERIILPSALRLTAFDLSHGYLHLGKDKTILNIAKDYWWPKMNSDIAYWVKTCPECQANKVFRHNKPTIGFYPSNIDRFQYLHMDLMGPFSIISNNNKYILTIKDRGTGFLITTPIKDKKAETVREAFIQSWVGTFGAPQIIITDNGKEFKNSVLEKAFEQLGIDHHFVPPYNPQSNGYIERQHKSINIALRALNDKDNWALHLPLITTSINNSLIEGTPFTPTQYAFGTCTNLSGRVLFNIVPDDKQYKSIYDTKIFLHSMSKLKRNHLTL